MTKVTVAPIKTTAKGLSSEVPLGRRNGLDHECVAAVDNTVTILAAALVLAFDLDVPLLQD